MKIAVIGATGMVGSRVTGEAAARGHDVTAVFRREKPTFLPAGVSAVQGDATDRARMSKLFTDADAIVAATRPHPGQEYTVATTITTLLDAAEETRTRILVVGGAGPLRPPGRPDQLVLDNPDYVPQEWRTIAAASVAQLEACRSHPADWIYLSPPTVLEPGRRIGTYRRGETTLLTNEEGASRISAEDLAVAVLDELENPRNEQHFTVAY
ncbi:NAD(P)-dependent oxidoreductase [Saccharopolyspora pogona]|uniref:NAD(P)-dependent oxidoreductase n=1 Tax=Saccharopolyspora pogona TaxID=333966 RepID=UPI00168A28C7|nr:NAD(P)H-binding protein [Saccharopolyspora pogona]